MHIPDFSFYRTPSILFGAGTIKKLGTKANISGKKVFLVTGANSLKKNGYMKTVQKFSQTII